MINKKIIVLSLIVIVLVITGCDVLESNESKALTIVQSYSEDGLLTLEDHWERIAGENGKLEWQSFKPKGYSNPEIYCVQVDLTKEKGGEENSVTFQYLVNIETESWDLSFHEINGQQYSIWDLERELDNLRD